MQRSTVDASSRLNLGCGARVVEDWINVDYALGARLAKWPGFRLVNSKLKLFAMDWDSRIILHDLTRPFPWTDSSIAVVYSSHTLEHLSREQGEAFVRQCCRVLRRGGLLRIIVPDLRGVVERYVSGALPAEHFVEELGVLYEYGGSSLKARLAPLLQYPHKCMYDANALVALMKREGFDARARVAFDSGIQDIDKIEIQGRTEAAVIVEGCKI